MTLKLSFSQLEIPVISLLKVFNLFRTVLLRFAVSCHFLVCFWLLIRQSQHFSYITLNSSGVTFLDELINNTGEATFVI